MNRSSPSGSAFTLLEVLAAVAVLGILYVVLADVAIQGLRAEGRSRRRMEASLVADRHLSNLETDLEVSGVLEVGRTESEEDAFRIFVEVRPFELPLPPESGADTSEAAGVLASLREIELTVTWDEGMDEERVVRTTYGFDREAVSAQLSAVGGAREGGS
jgi:prepilin-type N-terminal cleavage/methylation domain-containing protein